MWWTAIMMGLAGSLHCAGMCSPLAMAITQKKPFLFTKVIYNIGRIITYGALGSVAALLGSSLIISPYQSFVSFAIGVVFLLLGIGSISSVQIPYLSRLIQLFAQWIKNKYQKYLTRKTFISIFMMGLLNGLMPCGLTYLAMTYCFILPHSVDGFLFMTLFGLGTWPVMIGFTWLLSIGYSRLKINFQRVTTVVFLLIGIWLLARVSFNQFLHTHNALTNGAVQEVVCP